MRMLLQIKVKDTQSEFLISLLKQLKDSVISIKVLDSNNDDLTDNDIFEELTDKEKWEKYGNWDPDEDEEYTLAQHKYNFECLAKEYS
jgi:hypothetical protein